MYIGYLLEKHFLKHLKLNWDERASFLTEEPDLWYNGGFEDISTNIAWKWNFMTRIMNNYTLDYSIAENLVENITALTDN
jgi:hypothetical protein